MADLSQSIPFPGQMRRLAFRKLRITPHSFTLPADQDAPYSVHAPGSSTGDSEEERQLEGPLSTTVSTSLVNAPVKSFPFMALPAEIRNRIYSHVVTTPPGESFDLQSPLCNWSFSGVSSDIFFVSRQINREAFNVFLRQNDFFLASSIPNPAVFLRMGPSACSYIRYLSMHLNNRKDYDSFLFAVNRYCIDLRHLTLRTNESSPFLDRLANLLRMRAQLDGTEGTKISLEVSIRTIATSSDPSVNNVSERKIERTKRAMRRGFNKDNPLLRNRSSGLQRIVKQVRTITIKGCLEKKGLALLERFSMNGWAFEKTDTIEMSEGENEYRSSFVVRTWKRADGEFMGKRDVWIRN